MGEELGKDSGETPKLALLVAAYEGIGEKPRCEEHLEELQQLVETLGIDTLQKIACPVRRFSVSTYLSSGKVEELVGVAKAIGANVVIIDDEILPSQQRNLEELFGIPVIDRTEVILEVFAQRARTKEAKLQIELAQVKYQFPRLKRLWTHLSRQRGGGANQKGEGEKQLEIDRRLLKRRLGQLQEELKKIKKVRTVKRAAREKTDIPTFAIIGYTNVGKSTLLKALTNADVLVEDKLFATLDTTVRRFSLPNHQEVLLIDTVGFIRKLPHTLIAAFRSTIEEAIEADILIHLIDVSHPMAEEQAMATREVLKELKADKKPMITVLNKIDKCETPSMLTRFRLKYPKTVALSAKTHEGFDELMELMSREVAERRFQVRLRIPQSDYSIISELIRNGQVLNQSYEENDVLLFVEIPVTLKGRVESYRHSED